ncbi:MAG TPA: HAD family hydrolase [Gaiellaceae bacterium]|nr:HAD family hydrolase [Gaiellaceae bacterium]
MAEIESLRSHWRSALLSADAALKATDPFLAPNSRHELRKHLSEEYAPTTQLLRVYAHDEGIPAELGEPFLPRARARLLLRLPAEVTGCVFELDGVLVDGDSLHRAAWQRAFDELLEEKVESTYRRVAAPFDPTIDYTAYLRGRPRLDGVRAFLASRGARLPEEDVLALAERKREIYLRLLAERGIHPYDGVRHYLERANDAGLVCTVESASEHANVVLALAGLARLVVEDAELDPVRTAAFVARGSEPPEGFAAVVVVEPGRLGSLLLR